MSLDIEISEALALQKDAIVKGLIQGAIDGLKSDLSWKIREAVQKEVGEWIAKEVLPAVQEQLAGRRGELIAELSAGISGSFKVAADQLVQTAAKRLSEGYHVRELTKAVFG